MRARERPCSTGKEIDNEGNIIDPIRCDWTPGGVFVTPPGWWHSHHNESDELAWVLPMQDAGLYTHQRTLVRPDLDLSVDHSVGRPCWVGAFARE